MLVQFIGSIAIVIRLLCLLRVMPLLCSCHSSFASHAYFFSSWWQRDCQLFTLAPILVLRGSRSMSPCQPQTTYVFAGDHHWSSFWFSNKQHYLSADSRIGLLCHALRICVAYAPQEFRSSCQIFRACYENHPPLLHHTSLPQYWSVQTSIPGQPLWVPQWCFCVAHWPQFRLPSESPHLCWLFKL